MSDTAALVIAWTIVVLGYAGMSLLVKMSFAVIFGVRIPYLFLFGLMLGTGLLLGHFYGP